MKKKVEAPPVVPVPTLEEAKNSNPLRIRRRSVANLTENQMADVAGGHPHHTCEPTCPATCCPTCPNTCGDTCRCPWPTDRPTCPQTCETCESYDICSEVC